MYEELVKSLRQCAEASCAGCKNKLVEIGCRGKLQREAADAIEELSKRGAEAIKNLQDYMQKEKADQEIHVGDEVERCDTGEKYIVLQTRLNLWAEPVITALHRGHGDINTYRIDSDGCLRFRKTGNHFPQVAELMTEIGGNDG